MFCCCFAKYYKIIRKRRKVCTSTWLFIFFKGYSMEELSFIMYFSDAKKDIYLTVQVIFCQIKLGGGCIFTSKSCSARGGIA